jgi:hypothetical protein
VPHTQHSDVDIQRWIRGLRVLEPSELRFFATAMELLARSEDVRRPLAERFAPALDETEAARLN